MPPADKTAPRFPVWVWGVAALVPLGMLSAWVVAHFGDATEPRWTELDVPPAPPDAENGWAVVRDGSWRLSFGDTTEERLEELLDPSRPIDERLAIFDVTSGTLRLESERFPRELAAALRALDRLRFADACPYDAAARCPGLELLTFQSLIALRAFGLASQDRHTEALSLAARALRAHVDLAATSHGFVTITVAGMTLRSTLTLLEDLVRLAERSELAPESWEETALEIRELLDARRSLDGAQAVRGDYLFARRGLDSVSAESSAAIGLDDRATSAAIDAHYLALHAFAEDPSLPAPTVPALGHATAWWLHNPIGERLLGALLQDMGLRLEQIREIEHEIDAEADAVRRSLPE